MAKFDRFQPATYAEEKAAERAQLREDYGDDIIMEDEDVFKAEISELQKTVITLMNLLYLAGEERKGMKKAYDTALSAKELSLAQAAEEKRQLRIENERLYANRRTDSKNAA